MYLSHTLIDSQPAGTWEDMKDKNYHDFHRRLFHGSITAINETVKPYMKKYDLIQCADRHFHQAIYGLGPHIADYPEQSVAAGTVYGWCVTYVILYCVHDVHVLTSSILAVTLTLQTSTTQQLGSVCWINL